MARRTLRDRGRAVLNGGAAPAKTRRVNVAGLHGQALVSANQCVLGEHKLFAGDGHFHERRFNGIYEPFCCACRATMTDVPCPVTSMPASPKMNWLPMRRVRAEVAEDRKNAPVVMRARVTGDTPCSKIARGPKPCAKAAQFRVNGEPVCRWHADYARKHGETVTDL